MAQYKTPGVYTEEQNTFSNSIEEVPTSIPVFIGYTEKAKVNTNTVLNIPTRITSFHEYIEYFGGAPDYKFKLSEIAYVNEEKDSVNHDIIIGDKAYSVDRVGEKYNLYNAIRLFISNGGGTCYILSIGNYKDALDKNKFCDGLIRLETEREPTIVVIPEVVYLPEEDCTTIQNEILKHCAKMQNRFGILDIYDGYKKISYTQNIIENFRNSITANERDFGAAYYPWLNTSVVQSSELSETNLIAESLTLVQGKPEFKDTLEIIIEKLNVLPPASAMAGVYTMVDKFRGVWKFPANVSINSVVSPSVNISEDEQDDLNVPLDGKSVNAIRSFPGQGVLVWGARTLKGNSQDWRYINVKRTMIMLEQSIKNDFDTYIIALNDQNTKKAIKNRIEHFLTNLWKKGALVGSIPSEAFSVEAVFAKNVLRNDLSEDVFVVDVFVAVLRPKEFLKLSFNQKIEK